MARFEKGHKLAKGRPKGVPNKVTADLKQMVLGALDKAGGEKYLLRQALDNPNAFLSLVGKCFPKEVKAELSGKVTLEELISATK